MRNCFSCIGLWTLSWLVIDTGEHSPLWAAPTLSKHGAYSRGSWTSGWEQVSKHHPSIVSASVSRFLPWIHALVSLDSRLWPASWNKRIHLEMVCGHGFITVKEIHIDHCLSGKFIAVQTSRSSQSTREGWKIWQWPLFTCNLCTLLPL